MNSKIFICLILIIFVQFRSAAQTLNAGDIAFTGYNSDDAVDDDFAFILLRDIVNGTTISFTDFGWITETGYVGFQSANPCGANTGSTSDGIVSWTATSDLKYGTQVRVQCRRTLVASTGTVTGIQQNSNAGEYISLATGGDQLFAFRGDKTSPILLAGIGMNGAWDATLLRCQFTGSASPLPPALSTNNYAFNILPEIDNARIKSPLTLTGNAATDRATIHNAANWDVNDVTTYTLPAPNITTLPVNFQAFSASTEKDAVRLEWKVAKETNLKGYDILRSADGTGWQKVGYVQAKGLSVYTWSDQSPEYATNYYKIASIDLDGSSKYTNILSARFSASRGRPKLSPNPIRDIAYLDFETAKTELITISLIDANGAVIWQREELYSRGAHSIRMPEMKQLRSGQYILKLQSKISGTLGTTRFLKL